MWISKEKYEKLQREVADSKVERYYHNFDTSCIGSNGDTVTIGALSCVVNCKHCIEYGGNNTDHPWVRCRKRPEGRSIDHYEIMKDKFDGITKAILGIKDDGKPKEVLSWEKLYYEGHAKWNAECLNLKNRIKELEAQNKELKDNELKHLQLIGGISFGDGLKNVSDHIIILQLKSEVDRLNTLSINQFKQYDTDRRKWNEDCVKLNKTIFKLREQLDEKQSEIVRLLSEKDPSTITAKYNDSYLENARPTGSIVDSIFGKMKEHEGIVIDPKDVTKHVRKPLNFSDFAKDVEKPYYHESTPDELCDIKNDGTCIGSVSCRDCEYCIFCSKDFIKCKLKPEGKAKPEPKKPEWDTTNIGGIKISTLKQEPKKPESIKFDKYGVISETKNNDYCDLCIYTNELASSEVCQYCTDNNKSKEYYSSK